MNSKRLLPFILLPTFLLPACISYTTHTIPVLVQDAQTGAPVAGCKVGVWHPTAVPPINAPDPVSAVTDAAGKATLRVADWNPVWSWEHPDYGGKEMIRGREGAWPVPEGWEDPAHPGCAVLRLKKQ